MYVHHANHNFFNRRWLHDDAGGAFPLMPRSGHERVLSAYGCALYRSVLLGHATEGFLFRRVLPAGVQTGNVHLSFEIPNAFTVDDHEDGNGIGKNSLDQPTSQAGGLMADEYYLEQGGGAYNGSFYGDTIGMVAEGEPNGTFRSPLDSPVEISTREIWVRAAEVFEGSVPPEANGFQLGVEDAAGSIRWVDVDDVGGLPRPFDRSGWRTKTMLATLRFPGRCFIGPRGRVAARALLLRLTRRGGRPVAFDVLQIV